MGIGRTLYKFSTILLAFTFFFGFGLTALASEGSHGEAHEKEFNPADLILHHVTDAHKWEFAHSADHSYSVYLPVIAYTPDQGVKVFSSSHLYPQHGGEHQETTTHKGEDGHEVTAPVHEGLYLVHEHMHRADGGKVTDLSITKNTASLFISVAILFGVFFTVSGAYKKRSGQKPSGLQSFIEPIIIFVRDEIAKPNIGPRYERFLPYLLTVFFFIWINNLLGLLPGGANLTGNIAVTLVLAVLTFLITTFSANKSYWMHIVNTPGVPWWLKFLIPLMPLIEFMGIFTKPFSLMIRLFANITAGHIVILSLISLTFMFNKLGAGASFGIGIGASIFVVGISFLELLVALLQAYVFTLLTAMYFGGAVAEHEHEHDHVGDPHANGHNHANETEHEFGQMDHGAKASIPA